MGFISKMKGQGQQCRSQCRKLDVYITSRKQVYKKKALSKKRKVKVTIEPATFWNVL